MNEKIAGERKRTVSVTIGPLSWKLMEEIERVEAFGTPGYVRTPSDWAGCALTFYLMSLSKRHSAVVPEGWRSHFD